MDKIENLLAQTGWSCDDLLERLVEFKTKAENADHNLPCTKDKVRGRNNSINAKSIEEERVEPDEVMAEIVISSSENEESDIADDEISTKYGISMLERENNSMECDENNIECETVMFGEESNVKDNTENEHSNTSSDKYSIVDFLKNKLSHNEVDISAANENNFDMKSSSSEIFPIHMETTIEDVKPSTSQLPDVTRLSTSATEAFISDHDYTVKPRSKDITTYPNSVQNLYLKEVRIDRRRNYWLRRRRLRRKHFKLKKIGKEDRKCLITQYKSPEMVRSQIMEQLELLRSRRSNFTSEVGRGITVNEAIVSRKRYSGEKNFFDFSHNSNVQICDKNSESDDGSRKKDLTRNNFDKFEEVNKLVEGDPKGSKQVDVKACNKHEQHPRSSAEEVDDFQEDIQSAEGTIKNIVIVNVQGGCHAIPEHINNSNVTLSTKTFVHDVDKVVDKLDIRESDVNEESEKVTENYEVIKISDDSDEVIDLSDEAEEIIRTSGDSEQIITNSNVRNSGESSRLKNLTMVIKVNKVPNLNEDENEVIADTKLDEDVSNDEKEKMPDNEAKNKITKQNRNELSTENNKFGMAELNRIEFQDHTIKPTKTHDITKIKGWKNKKFHLDVKDEHIEMEDVDIPIKDEITNDVIEFDITTKEETIQPQEIKSVDEVDNKKEEEVGFINESESITAFANSNLAKSVDEVDSKMEEDVGFINESESNTAFASSNLDGFLESADLHISFKIPFLNSTAATQEEKPIQPVVMEKDKVPPQESLSTDHSSESMNLYRPRTLAQRNRIMKFTRDMKNKKRQSFKPRTLAEKRKLLDSELEKKLEEKNNMKHSHLLFRGRKLRVPTRTQRDGVFYIKSKQISKEYKYIPLKRSATKSKPSIFKNTTSPSKPSLKYRPGPLCKKASLQLNSKSWITLVKRLPKVTLRLIPEYKIPIDPRITHLLPEYGFDISPDRLEFALTALKPLEKEIKVFGITVPYQNHQEDFVLRKRKMILQQPVMVKEETSIEETCKDVVDKILNYLEIKEISDEVIQNEEVNTQLLTEDRLVSTPKKTEGENGRKRKPRLPSKLSKTNMELKRLNVKVIEVDLEEKEEIKDCDKDYCRLGCVCNSLSTTSLLVSKHCGRAECMFKCMCNYEKTTRGNVKVTLPIGTDLLSDGAVSRLEVEAKKNLAKVEKEFIQTVIQSNNQTIVVGGCSNRQRRVPKKYYHFFEDNGDVSDVEMKESDHEEEKPIVDSTELKRCYVQVQKLDIDSLEIIPFCLVHNLYDCHCELKANFPPNSKEMEKLTKDTVKNRAEETANEEPETLQNVLNNYTNNTEGKPTTVYKHYPERFEINYCTRTRGIPTAYYLVRNRSDAFKHARDRKFTRDMSKLGFRLHYSERENKIIGELPQTYTRKKRKQELVARRDTCEPLDKEVPTTTLDPNEFKFQSILKQTTNVAQTQKNTSINKFQKLFPKAKENVHFFNPSVDITQKFLTLLGRKEDTVFYLLQWKMLATSYCRGKIHLWYSTCFKVPRIIITDNKIIPKYFTNIIEYEKVENKEHIKNDIIRSLVTGNVPGGHACEEVQVIVELSEKYCQIHGTIKKNQGRQENFERAPESVLENKVDEMNKTVNKIDRTEIAQKRGVVNETNDRNLDPVRIQQVSRKIMFTKHKYPKVMLTSATKLADQPPESLVISACLPPINDNCLWRLLTLSDFSVLSLARNCYAIKFLDLKKVVEMAADKEMTIALKTKTVTKNYPHKDFGIYASPEMEGGVFIGPYYCFEKHDICTLRYVNRELVKTEDFNKLRGISANNSGVWLKQSVIPMKSSLQTIDLTDSDHEDSKDSMSLVINFTKDDSEISDKVFSQTDLDNFENQADDYVIHHNHLIDDDVSDNVPPAFGAIYFITNVKAFGYILGHKLSKDGVLVRWPSYNRVLKFKTFNSASTYLQRELSSSFVEDPNFTIRIHVTEDCIGNVFNHDYLRNYYLVTHHAVTNILDVTHSVILKLGMSFQLFEELVKQRAQKMVYDRLFDTGRALFKSDVVKTATSTSALLNLLQENIQTEQQQEKELLEETQQQVNTKSELLNRFLTIFRQLPPRYAKLKKRMGEVLKRHGLNVDISGPCAPSQDVICIDIDSDEEQNCKIPVPELANTVSVDKLPIFTKNPDMIIMATAKDSPKKTESTPLSENISKTVLKTPKDLGAVSKNMDNVHGDEKIKGKHIPDKRKFLLKAPSGKTIELNEDQYTKLQVKKRQEAGSVVTNVPSKQPPRKPVQLGGLTIIPKLQPAGQAVLTKLAPTREKSMMVTSRLVKTSFTRAQKIRNLSRVTAPSVIKLSADQSQTIVDTKSVSVNNSYNTR